MPPAVHMSHHMGEPPSPSLGHSSSGCSVRSTNTSLTYSRRYLIDTAHETVKIAENGEYSNRRGETVRVKEALDYAVVNSEHYEHEFDFHAALRRYDTNSLRAPTIPENGQEGEGGAQRRYRNSVPDFLASSGGSLAVEQLDAAKVPPSVRRTRFPRTSFLVVSASWLESASELQKVSLPGQKVRVGVLNSGSSTTPGGRFLKGTVSQEDCLCRASLLYACISQPKFQTEGRYYGKNRSFKYGTSNCVIFSPDVPVIRRDNVEGKLLDEFEKVSFVTIPAPNAFSTSINTGKEYNDVESEERQNQLTRLSRQSRSMSVQDFANMSPGVDFDERFEQKRQTLLNSLSDRIHRALSAFVLGDCTDLVLPAFGCGVHGNDPSMVAGVFREMLTDPNEFGGRFRTVVFAIPPSRKHNYQAFTAYFQREDVLKRGS